MSSARLGVSLVSMHMELTDTRGRRFVLEAMADVGGPWNIYATTTYTALMRWRCGDRTGYGVVMEVLPITALTRRYGRRSADWPAAITTG